MDEIARQGMEYEIAKYEPWESCKLDHYPDEDCVVFYGTLNLGRQLQKQKGWIPGAYCNFKNLCCKTYYSYWGKYLFNQDYIMMPFLEIKRNQDWVFEKYGVDDTIFMRPDSGAKPFTGQTLAKEMIDKEYKLYAHYAGKPLDEIIAVISSAKVIYKEWRFVVVDKKVIAGSQYKKNGKLDINRDTSDSYKEALVLAQEVANEEWQPEVAYTLDICKSNGRCYLLEANSFSCSGLYDCDPEPIVREISRVALEEWKDHNEPPEEV
jgi:hypothetical protein